MTDNNYPRHRGSNKKELEPRRRCINGPQNGGTCQEYIHSRYPGFCNRCRGEIGRYYGDIKIRVNDEAYNAKRREEYRRKKLKIAGVSK